MDDNRIKQLEIEITYLKRELDSLKMLMFSQKANITNTTNNVVNNINQMPDFGDYPEDEGLDFLNGINLN